MKLPNPLAVSKQEAYLAIKSGKLTQEQYDEVYKPSLLNPDNNFEAWLAKWCGLVEGYPKDENNVPLCLCDEEALVAYLCGVKTTYPADHQNPMDVRLAAYLRYLINGIYGRPEYPVTTSEYWLSQMDAPNITNDTPSASFELNDTAEAPLLDLKAFGDTSQNTTSGKNIFPLSIVASGTGSGVTFTNNGDSLDIKGTATAGIDKGGYIPLTSAPADKLTSGQTYTLSVNKPLPTGVKVQVLFYTDSAWAADGLVMTGNGTITNLTRGITIPSTATRVRYIVTVTNGTTVDITGLKIMLVRNLIDLSKEPDYKNLATATYTANSSALSIASDTSTTAGNRFCGYYLTNLTKGAEYRLSIKSITTSIASGNRVAMIRSYNGSSATEITTIPNSSDLSATFKVPDNSQRIEVFFYTTKGTTSVFNGVWLEAGSTATDFEPYTGGVASPSPDYPQTVQTVTGRQVVAVGSNNLAVFTDGMRAEAGVTTIRYALEQKATILGTANSDNWPILASDINVYAGKTYVMSITRPLPFPISFRTRGINSRLMNIPAGSTVSNSWTPSEDDYGWIFASVTRGTTVYETDIRVQVEEGTTATEYKPAQRLYEVNLGKNLFNKDNLTSLGVGSYFDGDATSPTIVITPGNYRNETVYFRTPVKGEITLSVKDLLPFSVDDDISQIQLGASSDLPAEGVSVTPLGSLSRYTPTQETITATIPTTANYLLIRMQTNSNVDVADWRQAIFDAIQIETGSTATPYAPYFEPIELCKIGSGDTAYQDVIFWNNPISEYFDQSLDLDKWYIKKMVGKQQVAPSDITLRDTYTNIEYAVIPKPEDYLYYASSQAGISNSVMSTHAVSRPSQGWDSTENIGGIYTNAQNYNFWVGFAKGTGLDAIKNALSGMTNYYALKEPAIEPIEGELADQLDAIVSGGTYEGYTAFTVESAGNNLPALLQVKAIPQVDPNAAENTRWYGAKKDPAEWTKTE